MDVRSTTSCRMLGVLIGTCLSAAITSCSTLANEQPRLIVYTHQTMSSDQLQLQLRQCDITADYSYLRTIFGNGHVVQFHAVNSAALTQQLHSACAKKFIDAIDVDSHVNPNKN
ncbi:MAG: hypothetical protein ACI8SR_002495 [Oceanicoccus sp.]|jgi:hypothetical protein